MNIKREIFHILLKLAKKQSRDITGILKGLRGEALREKRHGFIRVMRTKSRFCSKLFHRLIGTTPKCVRTQSIPMGGVEGLKLTPANPGKKVIFYLHGGGFIMGLLDTVHHYGYLPNLAKATNAVIYAIDYRVAPEHPFPAAVDDALAGYTGLLEEGIDPRNIFVMGDSAGGTLTLSLILMLRDMGLPLPAGSITLSPATAPVSSVESFHEREALDLMFTQEELNHIYTPAYVSAEHYDSPYQHPLFGDYEGLPPMLIFVGGREMLYDHSVLVAQKARLAGVDVTLDIHDEMIHAYPVLYDLYDEAKTAMEKVVVFVNRVVA